MWSRSLRNKKKEEGFTGAQQVYDCALDLLSYRDYSHKDMVERLQRKGATKAQALEAVDKLEDYGQPVRHSIFQRPQRTQKFLPIELNASGSFPEFRVLHPGGQQILRQRQIPEQLQHS